MILRDPVHGLVAFEAEQYRLIPLLLETKEVQRLRRVRQLGLASFAYPGADHTRFSHALGTAHVMTRFVARLRNIHERLPFWQRLTTERARDAVAAALLHDVGHGPFSHLFEEALPSGPKHEEWTRRILLDPNSEVHQVLRNADAGMPARVAQLVAGEHELRYLAHTVSGMFDVDRCDYLLRDALFTGVTYGQYDLDWLLRSLCFDETESDTASPALAVDGAKGIPAIESFVQARLFMFQQVYFHKAGRASERLLTRILARASELLIDGTHLGPLPDALRALIFDGDCSLESYLELDDPALWQCLRSWQTVKDPMLADLATRLARRDLFKTYEFFGPACDPEVCEQAVDVARDIAKSQGFDPDVYVGLDRAVLIPYDDSKQKLRVAFPDGHTQPLHEVSFLLGRLRGQKLEKVRLLFPAEIREQVVRELGSRRLIA
jgi:uncharacterized protein